MSTYIVWLLLENVYPHIKYIPPSTTRQKIKIKISITINWIFYVIKYVIISLRSYVQN